MEEEKKEVKFYKQKWFIIVAIIVALVIISQIVMAISKGQKSKEEWAKVVLSEYIPEPKKGNIDVISNSKERLSFYVRDIKFEYYQEYMKQCIDMGYDQESDKEAESYTAFNSEGYKLRLNFYTDEISAELEAPVELNEISWPTTGLGSMLPTPTSTKGKINSDSSSSFSVKIGNTSLDEYNKYVKACEDKGFNVDYSKQDNTYHAKNSEEYSLYVYYRGNNTMEIDISKPYESSTTTENTTTPTTTEPEKETPSPTTTETTPSTTSSTPSTTSTSSGISDEFKKSMESYESFMNEYVDFMKKYKDSNGTDTSLLADYANYMSKYTQVCKDFEAWEDKELSNEELSYYLDVQTRINKKLLEVT